MEAYRTDGFRSAVVDTALEPMGENEKRVVFLVDEGDKIKIESIDFTGNTVFSDRRLRYAMKKTRQRNFYQFWDSKDVYNQANYEEDIESVKKVYQNAGYKDIVAKDPVIETFVVNPDETRRDKVKRRARIEIPLVEGERFYFGDVKVEGTTVFPGDRLLQFFDWSPGKPLKRAALVDGMKTLDEIYRGRGYIYAFMNPEYTERPGNGNLVDVVVRVTEGDMFRVGRVEFTGNKTTKDKVLRREIPLFEGDVLDMETFKKGLLKLSQLGYFKIEEDPDFRVDSEKKVVDVTIKGSTRTGTRSSSAPATRSSTESSGNSSSRPGTSSDAATRSASSSSGAATRTSSTSPSWSPGSSTSGCRLAARSSTARSSTSTSTRRRRALTCPSASASGCSTGCRSSTGTLTRRAATRSTRPRLLRGSGIPPAAYADYIGKTSAIAPATGTTAGTTRSTRPGGAGSTSRRRSRRTARRQLLVRQAGRRGHFLLPHGRKSHFAVNMEGASSAPTTARRSRSSSGSGSAETVRSAASSTAASIRSTTTTRLTSPTRARSSAETSTSSSTPSWSTPSRGR
jgi:Outer membrane protein/protective antigen OMA87